MAGKTKSVLLDQIYPISKQLTNLNHTCPYIGQMVAKDLEIGFKYLKFAIIPAGEYRVELDFLDEKQLIINTKIQFSVDDSVGRTDPSVG